jgi:UDP-N-acetylmuramate: L-alanyl-gamma-D-glutamyl-meso-diaminopimelate ligase
VRIHFIAVAGTGMGALAGLLKASGHEVSGSDVAFDPPIGPELVRWGIRCMQGFDPAHLDPRPDLVVVGNVCRKDNVEACSAIASKIPVTSMPQALRELAIDPGGVSPLVVAGTHGKTTTSAIAAWLLDRAGKKPGFLIGGLPKSFETSFRPAPERGVPFVVEGDEYDSAFFEKTPKFWHYAARVAILTSIEHDHIDIYPTEQMYIEAFREFLRRLPETGLLVADAHDRRVVEAARTCCRAKTCFYALSGDETFGVSPDWVAGPAAFVDGMLQFEIMARGQAVGPARMKLVGRHNVRNAIAAVAAASEGYSSDVRVLLTALAEFEGVRRRQDLIGEAFGVRVYDDFAHHPTAVDETLRALKAKHDTGRLWAVFEPRSATACRAIHQQAYRQAFDAADVVIIAPLGRSNIPEAERLDVTGLAQALSRADRPAEAAVSIDAIVERIGTGAERGDTVAILSNGAFGGVHRRVLASLSKRESK